MRIVRFISDKRILYGIQEAGIIRGLKGSPFRQIKPDGAIYDLDSVRLLAPCVPSKVICLGLNYRSHAEETGMAIPQVPLIFMKPSTAIIGPDEAIVLPTGTRRTDYEGELAVVIGKKARHVTPEKTYQHILGYSCFNDVSERYNQRDDGQWTRAKGYDTFAPLGPCIATGIDPGNLGISTWLNGKVCQSGHTSDLIFDIPHTVSFISGVMTLLPGDVIATGTPAGIGPVKAGDVVEISVENVGVLRNPVVNSA